MPDSLPPTVSIDAETIPLSPDAIALAINHQNSIKIFHEKNLTSVDKALSDSDENLRRHIITGSKAESTFLSIYTMMLGIWCEARLHKLLYETGAFDENQRNIIYNQGSLEQKWKTALAVALRKQHKVPQTEPVSKTNVGITAFFYYQQILKWIDTYFLPVITRRNKIAHGQWAFAFVNYQQGWTDSSTFQICQVTMKAIHTENLLTIRKKAEILTQISTTVNNIAVDEKVYKAADFDQQYSKIDELVSALEKIDYKAYRNKAVSGYQKHHAPILSKPNEKQRSVTISSSPYDCKSYSETKYFFKNSIEFLRASAAIAGLPSTYARGPIDAGSL
jgi:hypothetical protein